MTLVKFQNKPATKSFNNFMDDFFTGMPSLFGDNYASNFNQFAPVNIKETESDFILEVVAPGLEKEDFKVDLDKNVLTISADKTAQAESNTEKLVRKEYKFQSFKRSFTIDENIDTENIVAKYLNGVLTLNLPKKAEVKEAVKQISIQ
jgi:HSP20 family protein